MRAICVVKPMIEKMNKCLKLDPKLGDLTIVRIIKVRTGYCCTNIRRTVVSLVKDNTDLDSWFSAKPIIVGNLSKYILAGTEINLRQGNCVLFCTNWGIVKILSVSMQTRNGKDIT